MFFKRHRIWFAMVDEALPWRGIIYRQENMIGIVFFFKKIIDYYISSLIRLELTRLVIVHKI